jgi:hypothetical protein
MVLWQSSLSLVSKVSHTLEQRSFQDINPITQSLADARKANVSSVMQKTITQKPET